MEERERHGWNNGDVIILEGEHYVVSNVRKSRGGDYSVGYIVRHLTNIEEEFVNAPDRSDASGGEHRDSEHARGSVGAVHDDSRPSEV